MFYAIEKGPGKLGSPFCHIFTPFAQAFNFIFLIFTYEIYGAERRDTGNEKECQLFAILSTFFMIFPYLF